jgi:peroxiredoxin
MKTMTVQRRTVLAGAAALAAFGPLAARAAASVGQPAPGFKLPDSDGKPVDLADFKGRFVVLEWTNPGCPFVQKHYGSQNMQSLQREFTGQKVAWLSISSTAKGHADYQLPAALAALYKDWGSAQTALLMDDDGRVGQAYGARTTPHMYIIDPKGVLIYAGGIDDKRSANPADVKTAKNHVRVALVEALAGKPVSTPTATPYGCSVKYSNTA